MRNAGSTAWSSTDVGHFTVELGLPREYRQVSWVDRDRGRSTQPNNPTSICANDDEVYCIDELGARYPQPQVASPATTRSGAGEPTKRRCPAIRAAIKSRPMAVIQPRGASVDQPRTGRSDAGAQAATPCWRIGAHQERGRADQNAAGDQHAHRPEHRQRRLVGVPSMFRPGAAQEDRSVDLHEARHGQGSDQGQRRRGEGRAGEYCAPAPGTIVPNRPR